MNATFDKLNYDRAWRERNRTKCNEQSRIWRINNLERSKGIAKKYRERNADKLRASRELKQKLNPNHSKEKARAWRIANPKKAAAIAKRYSLSHPGKSTQWYRANRIRVCAKMCARAKRRRVEDLSFMILGRMRARLYLAIKQAGANKSAKTMALVGCDVKFLKHYIESLFLPGMNWQNRHLWHVDHIKPCCKFDLTDQAQQKSCFHYTNLQPLWAGDNLRKWKW